MNTFALNKWNRHIMFYKDADIISSLRELYKNLNSMLNDVDIKFNAKVKNLISKAKTLTDRSIKSNGTKFLNDIITTVKDILKNKIPNKFKRTLSKLLTAIIKWFEDIEKEQAQKNQTKSQKMTSKEKEAAFNRLSTIWKKRSNKRKLSLGYEGKYKVEHDNEQAKAELKARKEYQQRNKTIEGIVEFCKDNEIPREIQNNAINEYHKRFDELKNKKIKEVLTALGLNKIKKKIEKARLKGIKANRNKVYENTIYPNLTQQREIEEERKSKEISISKEQNKIESTRTDIRNKKVIELNNHIGKRKKRVDVIRNGLNVIKHKIFLSKRNEDKQKELKDIIKPIEQKIEVIDENIEKAEEEVKVMANPHIELSEFEKSLKTARKSLSLADVKINEILKNKRFMTLGGYSKTGEKLPSKPGVLTLSAASNFKKTEILTNKDINRFYNIEKKLTYFNQEIPAVITRYKGLGKDISLFLKYKPNTRAKVYKEMPKDKIDILNKYYQDVQEKVESIKKLIEDYNKQIAQNSPKAKEIANKIQKTLPVTQKAIEKVENTKKEVDAKLNKVDSKLNKASKEKSTQSKAKTAKKAIETAKNVKEAANKIEKAVTKSNEIDRIKESEKKYELEKNKKQEEVKQLKEKLDKYLKENNITGARKSAITKNFNQKVNNNIITSSTTLEDAIKILAFENKNAANEELNKFNKGIDELKSIMNTAERINTNEENIGEEAYNLLANDVIDILTALNNKTIKPNKSQGSLKDFSMALNGIANKLEEYKDRIKNRTSAGIYMLRVLLEKLNNTKSRLGLPELNIDLNKLT